MGVGLTLMQLVRRSGPQHPSGLLSGQDFRLLPTYDPAACVDQGRTGGSPEALREECSWPPPPRSSEQGSAG